MAKNKSGGKPKIQKDNPKLGGGKVKYSNEDRSKTREEGKSHKRPATSP